MSDEETLTVAEGEVKWAELHEERNTVDARIWFDIEDVPEDQHEWVRELIENGTGTFSVVVEDGGRE